jgi:hypothetical protein
VEIHGVARGSKRDLQQFRDPVPLGLIVQMKALSA